MSYAEFFLNSPSSTVQLELLELSHPNFTKTYRIVRNAVNGITVTLEDSSSATFSYYPVRIEADTTRETLDQAFNISIGDVGEVLPIEMDSVSQNDGFATKPTLIYRTYRSDDLTAPLFGPLNLEVDDFTFNREGAAFKAKAPSLNINLTGETYLFERFPMLRGFL